MQIANTNERKQKSHVKDPKPSTNTSSQNTGATMPDPRHFRASWLKPGAAVHWAILWWMNVDGRNPAPVGNSLVTMKHCKLWDCKGINHIPTGDLDFFHPQYGEIPIIHTDPY